MTVKCLPYIIHLKEYRECGCEFEVCLGSVYLIWCQYLDTAEDIPIKHVFEPNRASYQRHVSTIHSSYTEIFSSTSDTTTASYCSQKDLLTHQDRRTGTTYWLTGLCSTGTGYQYRDRHSFVCLSMPAAEMRAFVRVRMWACLIIFRCVFFRTKRIHPVVAQLL